MCVGAIPLGVVGTLPCMCDVPASPADANVVLARSCKLPRRQTLTLIWAHGIAPSTNESLRISRFWQTPGLYRLRTRVLVYLSTDGSQLDTRCWPCLRIVYSRSQDDAHVLTTSDHFARSGHFLTLLKTPNQPSNWPVCWENWSKWDSGQIGHSGRKSGQKWSILATFWLLSHFQVALSRGSGPPVQTVTPDPKARSWAGPAGPAGDPRNTIFSLCTLGISCCIDQNWPLFITFWPHSGYILATFWPLLIHPSDSNRRKSCIVITLVVGCRNGPERPSIRASSQIEQRVRKHHHSPMYFWDSWRFLHEITPFCTLSGRWKDVKTGLCPSSHAEWEGILDHWPAKWPGRQKQGLGWKKCWIATGKGSTAIWQGVIRKFGRKVAVSGRNPAANRRRNGVKTVSKRPETVKNCQFHRRKSATHCRSARKYQDCSEVC